MMNTNDRLLLMTQIADRHPGIGKTAMMKITYLLETLYDVPLGYHYEIYTYGPYCQSVMGDIEYAEAINYIKVKPFQYDGGMSGYKIQATAEGRKALVNEGTAIETYSTQIDRILKFFGNMKAKELELYSTIVFVVFSYRKNGWETSSQDICNRVHCIKPHFSIETIKTAYEDLDIHGFLKQQER